MSRSNFLWTRRSWLTTNAAALVATARGDSIQRPSLHLGIRSDESDRIALQSEQIDAERWEALARRAVEAARAAGAEYADARLTRTVQHLYSFAGEPNSKIATDWENVGVGVRALVKGYWGFAATPAITPESVVQVAQDAAAQATVNAKGPTRTIDLGRVPPVTGRWATPIQIDPFKITIEEKTDYIQYWMNYSQRVGVPINPLPSYMRFARQERVVATSDGTCITQTLYETSGSAICENSLSPNQSKISLRGLDPAGLGWELFLNADIPGQLDHARAKLDEEVALDAATRPAIIGRYTVVCDGMTMGSILDKTLGLATQIDRALGYEANAGGTSYLDDPFDMLGQFAVASPLVTVTTNRSAPAQLGTVRWDDEGVVPSSATLVTNGVLTDFQTTREQAGWLASYYQRSNHPIASNGCAGAENALAITMQHTPNLALTPNASGGSVDELVASVSDGILISNGAATSDFQARNGFLSGTLRKIKNGRLGPRLSGGAILFNSLDLWKSVTTLGGESTRATLAESQYPYGSYFAFVGGIGKGQPLQVAGHSISAPAAVLTKQSLIDPSRKA